MPSTYTLIKGETLASSAASYTFTAIPSTFTDLMVRVSARTDFGSLVDTISIKFNGATTNYSDTNLNTNSSSGSGGSSRATGLAYINGFRAADGSTATSSTFSSAEFYIPSYTASQNKPMSEFNVSENNDATAYISAVAALWRDTAAITSIGLTPLNGPNFVSGSSFYLYGIKNS